MTYLENIQLAKHLLSQGAISSDDVKAIDNGEKVLVSTNKVVRCVVGGVVGRGKSDLFAIQKEKVTGLSDFDKGKLAYPFVVLGVSAAAAETVTATTIDPLKAKYASDIASISNELLSSKIIFTSKEKKKLDVNISSLVTGAKSFALGQNIKEVSPFVINKEDLNVLELEASTAIVASVGTNTLHFEVMLHGFELLSR